MVEDILWVSFIPGRCSSRSSVLLLLTRTLDMYDPISLVLKLFAILLIFTVEKSVPRIETESKEMFIAFRDAMPGDDPETMLRNSLSVALPLLYNDDLVVCMGALGSSGQFSRDGETDDTCANDDSGLVVKEMDSHMSSGRQLGRVLLYGVDRW